jgi:hypothetical protein
MSIVSTIENYLFKNAAAKALTAVLNKLPANGGKLFLGSLLMVLGEVARDFPTASFSPYVAILIDVVQAAGPAAVFTSGAITTLIGALHKALKIYNPAIPDEPVIVQ